MQTEGVITPVPCMFAILHFYSCLRELIVIVFLPHSMYTQARNRPKRLFLESQHYSRFFLGWCNCSGCIELRKSHNLYNQLFPHFPHTKSGFHVESTCVYKSYVSREIRNGFLIIFLVNWKQTGYLFCVCIVYAKTLRNHNITEKLIWLWHVAFLHDNILTAGLKLNATGIKKYLVIK